MPGLTTPAHAACSSADAPRDAASATSPPDRRACLRQFVQAYWLRPENAFWMTLRSLALSRASWSGPSMDVSCGDGVFSFIHAGGLFDETFDVFGCVASLERVTHQHADMFDCAASDYAPSIRRRPGWTIEIGTDLKESMLAKAAALGLYQRLLRHDCNHPFPFPADAFTFVYCNSAYWVANVDGLLHELARIVTAGGRVVLHVKLDSMRRYTLAPWAARLGEDFLRIIGRGRFDCWPALASRGEWERRFARAGLIVHEAYPFATQTHSRLWDVGLRPIAPLLVRMANALVPQTRSRIKRDWVDLFCALLDPICREDFDLAAEPDEPAEIQYLLSRRP